MKLITLIFCLISAHISPGQMARLFTSADGLPSSKVGGLFQDSRGFIWVCTGNGLARFDGMEFETFSYDRNDPFSISSDLVLDVFEDSNHKLWISTSEDLQLFDPEENTFTKVPLHDSKNPDPHVFVISVTEVPNQKGILLVATSGRGIYVIDSNSGTQDIAKHKRFEEVLGTRFIKNLFFDSEGRLWVQKEKDGLVVMDYSSFKIYDDIWQPQYKFFANKIKVTAIDEVIESGNILIGTFNNGLFLYEKSTGRIRRVKGEMARRCNVKSILLRSNSELIKDSDRIWIGTEDQGVFVFDPNKEEIKEARIKHSAYDLSRSKIHTMMEDSQGNIWVGIFQKGLLVLPKSMYGFDYHYFNPSNYPGVNTVSTTAILKDAINNDLWVGTDGGGIYRVNEDNSVENFSNKNSALTNNSILSLLQDKTGTIWISTYIDGLFTFTKDEGLQYYDGNAQLNSVHTSMAIEDPKNNLLYVATLGGGVNVIDYAKDTISQLEFPEINKWVTTLLLDSSDNLWIGTYGGLRCYNTNLKKMVSYDIALASSVRVYALCESQSGILWIGSGEGLIAFDKKTSKSELYTKKSGLPSNVINSIVESRDGNIWISTNYGLSRYNPQTGKFKNYFANDGLQENEFNRGAAFVDQDGQIFFGGINGITSFYPHIVDQDVHKIPDIYFSKLTVLNEPVRFDPKKGEKNILDKHITQATLATLRNRDNMFSISFSVLEYTNPEKVVYRYKMEGFDEAWKYTSADRRVATYTNLPFGNYKFKVEAFFQGESMDNRSGKELHINILPPWYHTWWAYVLYFLILCAIMWILSVYLLRRKKIAEGKAELEKKDIRLQMFSNISHEIRTPLTLVMDPLKKLREGESDSKQKDLYSLMYRNSLRVLRLVNQLMDLEKIDSNQLKLKYLETDLIYFVKDVMQSFQISAATRQINFQLNTALDSLNVWIDQSNFDKVLFNILSNAFKFTPNGGNIALSISAPHKNQGELSNKVESWVEINIENTGGNIDEKVIEKIFDRFFQVDQGGGAMGTGIGLNLARMLVELHHGKITVRNQDHGRVVFTVKIPYGKAHLSSENICSSSSEGLFVNAKEKQRDEYIEPPVVLNEEENEKLGKSKPRLVIVDDNEELCQYIRMELQSEFNIEIYYNGQEAWEAITKSLPNTVVTDLVMDKMDGMELCRNIKSNPETNHISVIILTSQTDELSEQVCMDNGADRYLTKPVSVDLLKSCIKQAILTRETIKNKYRIHVDYGFHNLDLKTDDNKLIVRVIEEIRKNIQNPNLSVDFLSREIGMSRIHLNRKLKEIIQTSPSNLVKSIRMKQSAFLLIKHKVNISEVAYLVGFSTHSYFSNCFRDFFGVTPKEFMTKYADCEDEEVLSRFFE